MRKKGRNKSNKKTYQERNHEKEEIKDQSEIRHNGPSESAAFGGS